MKKLLTMLAMCIILCCALVLSVSAATSVTDDGSNMTLGDCTIANLDGVTIPSPTRGLVYSLDDVTMTATVTGRGSFAGGDIVIPSTVTYGGEVYNVKTVAPFAFNGSNGGWLTYNIYVPDCVTRLGGGSGQGCFGNSNLRDVYIGSGLTELEQEVFSGSRGVTAFVLKSKITKVGVYAFNSLTKGSDPFKAFELDLSNVTRFEKLAFNGATFISGIDFEFSPNIEYIGDEAFISSKISGTIIIPEDVALGSRCFNGTSFDLVVINVKEGTVKELPKELFSGASSGLKVAINGRATTNSTNILSGNSMSIYMSTKAQIEELVTAISKQSGSDRLDNSVTYYSCNDGLSFTSTTSGVLSEGQTASAHCWTTEAVVREANCTYARREAYICYACGDEDIISQGTELGNHEFETKTKTPSCQSIGYTEFHCTVCDLQEVGEFVDKTAHSNTVEKYGAVNGSSLEVSYYCEYCNTLDRTENVSLVNKCYIEGYGLFDATLEYVSVDANGVATPSGATFDKAVIYFPSFVMVGDDVVEVKTVQGFKAKSIKSIYIPDTVTRIAGGSGVGCFGDCYDLKNIVVGKGVTKLEQEAFCMGKAITVDEFIFKATITEIRFKALCFVSSSAQDIPHEFNTYLSYVGHQVNYKGNIIREAHIAKGCDLSEKKAFNDANGLVTVYIEGGDTPETALDLGQEFTSNTGTKYYYIKGYVTVSGQAVLAGLNDTRIFMESVDAIDVFANAIKKQNLSDRINTATFLDCETQKTWFIRAGADRIEHTVTFFHGGVITEAEASCTQGAIFVERCFICGATVSEEVGEPLEHQVDGGVITVVPNCRDLGKIVYTCIDCGEREEREIFHDYSTHDYKVYLVYAQGLDKAGNRSTKCTICDDMTSSETTLPIIVALGYSVRDPNGARDGLDGGYTINNELLNEYERLNGKVRLGIIIANANEAKAIGLVGEGFKVLGAKALQVELESREYSSFNLSIVGFTTDAHRALDLVISAYIVADIDGDGAEEISYIQYTLPQNNAQDTFGSSVLNIVSIDRACPAPVVSASYTGKED
ncbi:MAG: leucine-rich repeat protein [Clostridia bacterium]|nr:leucine-rich repeat protein [Clostridia bacterium]